MKNFSKKIISTFLFFVIVLTPASLINAKEKEKDINTNEEIIKKVDETYDFREDLARVKTILHERELKIRA